MTVLGEELKSSSLPQALLFHGPVYSGKLSAALEAACKIIGEEKAEKLVRENPKRIVNGEKL